MSSEVTTQSSSSPTSSSKEQTDQRAALARRARSSSSPLFFIDPSEISNAGPFYLVRGIREQIGRMFAKAGAGDLFMKPRWAPTIEVATRDRDLVVSVELPGLKEDDVKVEINDGVLVIQGRTQGRS